MATALAVLVVTLVAGLSGPGATASDEPSYILEWIHPDAPDIAEFIVVFSSDPETFGIEKEVSVGLPRQDDHFHHEFTLEAGRSIFVAVRAVDRNGVPSPLSAWRRYPRVDPLEELGLPGRPYLVQSAE